MTLRVGSLFSGIGGFDLGFERAGASVVWQAEIDKHARKVLAKHWPGVLNIGDVRAVGDGCEPVDVLCGGFPCQDLSVAGKRAGLAGRRSGLWYEFHRCLRELRPRWAVIENVPGLRSSGGGRDLAIVVRGLVELGYRVAWRSLDAQYAGLAQRRERVFIVGSLGDGCSAEVLFEREGVCWNPPARGEAWEGVAGTLGGSSQRGGFRTTDLDNNGAFVLADCLTASMADSRASVGNNPRPRGVVVVANSITASAGHHGHSSPRGDGSDNLVVDGYAIQERAVAENPATGPDGKGWQHERAFTLEARGTPQAVAIVISRRGRADGVSDELEEGIAPALRTGGGGSSVSHIVFDPTQVTSRANRSNPQPGDPSHPLAAGAHVPVIVPQAMSSKWAKGTSGPAGDEIRDLVSCGHGRVRRLTPTECERLQGFPDGWTAGQADSHRYRQLGNAVAVPVAEWIARRIVAVSS